MTKSLKRQIRRTRVRQLAEKILNTWEGDTLPTVEQLYLLIGAKDGMIYDLQMQLTGLVQEKQALEAEIERLQEHVNISPEIPQKRRLKAVTQETMPQDTQDVEDRFGATHKP